MYARDGIVTLRESLSTISSLVLLLVLISRIPTNELRVATNAKERIRIDYDSLTMSKNAFDTATGHSPVSTELRDPIKLYSHMNITDSMNVYHWTDIRRRF